MYLPNKALCLQEAEQVLCKQIVGFSKEVGNPNEVGGRENLLILKYWHLTFKNSNSVDFKEILLPATNLKSLNYR